MELEFTSPYFKVTIYIAANFHIKKIITNSQ